MRVLFMKVGQLLEMELEEEDGGIQEFIGCPRYGTVALNRYKTLHIVIRKYSLFLDKTEMSFNVLSSEMDLAESGLIR
jgi:hypothetical protein